MYGQIHCVIRELVQKKFGNDTWESVLKKSGLDEHQSFLTFNRYDDAQTLQLIAAVSETLDITVETVLEVFGEFFFDYCIRHGYDKMLRTLGSDIRSFIQNLDSLHALLALSYKGISAPSFRCEDGPDDCLILHYYSSRPGLYPIVKGVVKAVARDLFHQSVEMTVIEQNKEDIGCDRYQEHTAFRVELRCCDENGSTPTRNNSSLSNDLKKVANFNPEIVLLKASDFCSAFPYHVIFDRHMKIKQCGVMIQKHSSHDIEEGTPLSVVFDIIHPKMVISIENIRKFINAVFLLAICCAGEKKRMIVKGQMIWIEDTKHMIFIGSPRLTSLNELLEMNVYLADIPLYDVTRELVLLNQQRIAEIDIAKKLDETTAQLKKTGHDLEVEKRKTETLLHQMLPRKVATALTQGKKVEAEKFDQVTILFSDIVTFTNIASACSPMDIVDMLNEMYRRFDERTSEHNVYKVETIGDAYMIVSGVPEVTNYHAPPVVNFAMDMVEEAGHVMSPATGMPLQIRVGIHTGPVVAGVVGVKMPRYCLFGDTVNTASRMESHGVPGRIHLSSFTRRALQGWGYTFKTRGEMDVKGKGKMSTFFLCGDTNRRLDEPDDGFQSLGLLQDSSENRNLDLLKSNSTEYLDNDTDNSQHASREELDNLRTPDDTSPTSTGDLDHNLDHNLGDDLHSNLFDTPGSMCAFGDVSKLLTSSGQSSRPVKTVSTGSEEQRFVFNTFCDCSITCRQTRPHNDRTSDHHETTISPIPVSQIDRRTCFRHNGGTYSTNHTHRFNSARDQNTDYCATSRAGTCQCSCLNTNNHHQHGHNSTTPRDALRLSPTSHNVYVCALEPHPNHFRRCRHTGSSIQTKDAVTNSPQNHSINSRRHHNHSVNINPHRQTANNTPRYNSVSCHIDTKNSSKDSLEERCTSCPQRKTLSSSADALCVDGNEGPLTDSSLPVKSISASSLSQPRPCNKLFKDKKADKIKKHGKDPSKLCLIS